MTNGEHELHILEEIERNPDTTQATLAAQVGVAVGSVNWYVKRLIKKGYVKVTHLQRRKLHYFLTPAGLALKVKLTRSYMDVSLRTYRELRRSALEILTQLHQSGYTSVHIEGENEAAEILRLTCLEKSIRIEEKPGEVPTLRVEGAMFLVYQPNEKSSKV